MKQFNYDEKILDALAGDSLVDEYSSVDIACLPDELAEEIEVLRKEERAATVKKAAKYVVEIIATAEKIVSQKRSSLAGLRISEKRLKAEIFDLLVAKQYAINTNDFRPLLAIIKEDNSINYKDDDEKSKAREQVKEFLADKAKTKPKAKAKVE